MTSDRLDLISRPNLGRVARRWSLVTPNDIPPTLNGPVGNTGVGCFGLYVAMEGWLRVICRADQFTQTTGVHHDVDWLAITTLVELNLGGTAHPVQWLPAIPVSERIWAPTGTYLWGEFVHVLAHDSTVPAGAVHSLHI